MLPSSRTAVSIAALIVSMAGCATDAVQHQGHHPAAATTQAGGMPPGAPGDAMGMMDMRKMCDMHKKMMHEKTPGERKAMMDEHMKSMSPQMMDKHKRMLEECK